jgi:MFS family permease
VSYPLPEDGKAANIGRLYLISFVDMLQNYIDGGLNAYATSSFSSHGLLTVGSVISTALGGCTPLTMAKVIDIWGRVEGFCFMLLVCVSGMIVKAACTNVQSYIGGHILYWVGHIGLLYVVDVMCADITSLKNRMIIYGINETPRIAAAFAGPELTAMFLAGPGWRWAFGAFLIILVACSIPAMALMLFMYRKARKAGYAQKQRSGRSLIQSLAFYFIEFDCKQASSIIIMFILMLTSLWNHLDHGCFPPIYPAIHAGRLRPARMEDTVHHCHDRARHPALSHLRHLREISGSSPLSSLEVPP